MSSDNPTKLALRTAKSLKKSREDFEPHFQQLERNFLPRNGGFSSDPTSEQKSNRGGLINRHMLDSTPMRALRVLKSGMQAGITSPSRPWFRLKPLDPALAERPKVKDFFWRAEAEMRRMTERSGLYNVLHSGYGHVSVYGTECALIEDNPVNDFDLRGQQLRPGSFWLGSSEEQRIDTCYREFTLTVNQTVGKFVYGGNPNATPNWDRVTDHVKRMYEKGDVAENVDLCQLIMPRKNRDRLKINRQNMPIASQYWIKNDERDEATRPLAGNFGYETNPISASRWEVDGTDVWGISPAMEALPDVKELMFKRRDYNEMLRRVNRPPMNAHSDLRNSAFSLLPGAINFMAEPDKALRPAYEVDPQFSALREDIEGTKDSVWSTMYADLFMMTSELDRGQLTGTEIDERREEKLIALGPVLERMHFEKLKPLVERLFLKVVESGVLGPVPEELEGEDIEVDFISMLAQAQKAVATGGMERLAAFVGNISASKPDALDKLDSDALIDEYADSIGTPVRVIRPEDDVEALRRRRQEQEARMQQAEMAEQVAGAASQGAKAAKVLSEADSPRGAVPNDILARAGLA